MLNPSGTELVWSTYLGAESVDALALDPSGNVYATGVRIAANSPATGGTIGVVKMAPGGSILDVPANAIVNAASYAPGSPLAGGAASVFLRGLNVSGTIIGSGSPLPTELAGVSIVVGGAPAPILGISPVASGLEQINFQAPFEAASNVVEIRYQGISTFAIPLPAAPGVFTLSGGTAAIEHSSDYSLVTPSNAAHAGEVIVVYATGLGMVSPAVNPGVAASGPAPVARLCSINPVRSSLGSILYAGLTSRFVGLYQVNIQLPQDLPDGTAQFSISAYICELLPAGFLQGNTVNLPVR